MTPVVLAVPDPAVRGMLALLLHREGLDVVEAINPAEVFDLLDHRDLGVVVTDLDMPYLPAVIFIEEVRRSHSSYEIVGIGDHVTYGLRMCMLRKPFRAIEFLDVIRTLTSVGGASAVPDSDRAIKRVR
jgi:DNA-binding response OmpR family regulator